MKKDYSKPGDMHWYAMYQDINSRKFEQYDVLKYRENFIKDLKKKVSSKEEFAKKLRSEMMYYFWGKCEVEVILANRDDRIIMLPWPPGPNDNSLDVTDREDFDWVGFFHKKANEFYRKDEIKIDIFDQLNYRWDEFVDYCWNFHHKWQRKKVENNVGK